MNKRIRASIIIATLCLGALPVQAQSEAKLTTNVEHISESTVWETKEDAPGLKITIKDAYKRAGKTEKIVLQLNNAIWTDRNGTSVQIYDNKNIEIYKIALMSRGEDCLQLNVDIPSEITEEDEISFVVPLTVSARDKEISVTVEPGDDSELIDKKQVLIGAETGKKVSWEVNEIPTIVKEGTIASITLTELRPYIIEDEIEVTLILQNDDLAFGEFGYKTKDEHADDTDYEIDAEHYIAYGGGFSGLDTTMKLKTINKDDQKIVLKIKGGNTSEIGKMTLKNIPIINKSTNFKEEDVLLTLEGDALVDAKKDITVAYIRNKTKEDQEAEEKAKVEAEEAEEEAKEAEKKAQKGIQFKVGESSYTVNGTKYDMDAKTFIQSPGYIMVPLKYVALALGVYEEEIQYNNGMIYFSYGNKTIELRGNSDVARVNKVNIQMSTPVIINNGRSYAPMGEVARLLGLNREWKNEDKVAVFKEN